MNLGIQIDVAPLAHCVVALPKNADRPLVARKVLSHLTVGSCWVLFNFVDSLSARHLPLKSIVDFFKTLETGPDPIRHAPKGKECGHQTKLRPQN